MKKKQQIRNSCGGQGCSKDLFTLPYCGGKVRRVLPRRLRVRSERKAAGLQSGIKTYHAQGFTFHMAPTPGF